MPVNKRTRRRLTSMMPALKLCRRVSAMNKRVLCLIIMWLPALVPIAFGQAIGQPALVSFCFNCSSPDGIRRLNFKSFAL